MQLCVILREYKYKFNISIIEQDKVKKVQAWQLGSRSYV